MALGFVAFIVATVVTLNALIGFIAGITVTMVLIMITDPTYQKQRRRKLKTRHEEDKENRRWKREAYHKESGRRKASDDFEKDKKYNDYNELDIRNIGLNTKKHKHQWG